MVLHHLLNWPAQQGALDCRAGHWQACQLFTTESVTQSAQSSTVVAPIWRSSAMRWLLIVASE